MSIVCAVLQLYSYCVLGRVVLSWFPVDPHGPVGTVAGFLFTITEPVLGPIRSILPRSGFLDLSPLIVFFGIQILHQAICR